MPAFGRRSSSTTIAGLPTRRARSRVAATVILVLSGVTLQACSSAASGGDEALAANLPPVLADQAFADVTRAAGIDARHHLPAGRLDNIVDAVGAGATFADIDGDGWLDILLGTGAGSPTAPAASINQIRVYRNRRDGTFEDTTASSGIPSGTTAVAIAAADYDADGDRDLYVVDRGPNRLYRNRGDGTFDDVSDSAGVGDPSFGVGAAFFDMDGDGDLDLFVANYLEFDAREDNYYRPDGFPGPLAYSAQPDVLYRNLGDGTFEDASADAGLDARIGRGMSVVTADFDDDRDIDIFVANDATENFLWINDGEGVFEEAGLMSGLAMGAAGEHTSAMAADLGDIDRDGQLDLAVSDTAFGAVYLRRSPGMFVDEVMRTGVGPLCAQYVSWGQNLLDYDNDGDLDLFVVNGGLHHLVGWEDLLLENDGSGIFRDGSERSSVALSSRSVGRSSVSGDYDNDGDVDLLITTLDDRPVLLRNDTSDAASWLGIELVGSNGNDAYGARIRVLAGGQDFVAEARSPSAYLGQSDVRLHFGLGSAVDIVDEVEVVWPDGTVTQRSGVAVRQYLQLRQDDQ